VLFVLFFTWIIRMIFIVSTSQILRQEMHIAIKNSC